MSAPALTERNESDALSGALSVLRRRWPFVVGLALACALVAVVRHERGTKSYQATASVAFQTGSLPGAALQIFPSSSSEPQREANTEVLIAHSPEVADSVRRQLKTTSSTEELLSQVKVEAAPSADILQIQASSADPSYSARLANAFARQYIAFKSASELAGIGTAQTELQSQIAALPAGSPERSALEQSLQRLAESKAVAGAGAKVIGLATPPTSPSGASLSTTVIVGSLIGLALAFAAIFLLESLDRRIKTIDECEREYRLAALAGVPQSAFREPRADRRGEQLEPYRILRSALDLAAVTRQLDTLLVTSAMPGEGKTTVAIDLAHAVALTGRQVTLVELDLRRPTFRDQFALDGGQGLAAVLTRGATLSDSLVEPLKELPNLAVLPAGRLPHNPSELLGSARIAELIGELATEDGLVILDAPPLNPVADAQVLLNNSAIHAAVIVARVGRVTRDQIHRARSILDRHMVEPVGVVVTGLRDSREYGYGGYASSGDVADPAESDGGPRARSVRRRLPL